MSNEKITAICKAHLIVALLIGLILGAATAHAASFYEGKTVRIILGTRPGGTQDMRTRAVTSLLAEYIPGKPQILFEYMPGGGGRKAGNYVYNSATPDGLTIANVGSSFVSYQLLDAPGVRYDIDKMTFLGSGNSKLAYVFLTHKAAGLDTLEKLQSTKGVRIGAQSVGHTIYVNGRIFAWLLGMKEPRFVTGYSGPELDRAVVAGEIDGRVNIPDTVVQRSPEWIREKLVDFHMLFEIPEGYGINHPAFANLPKLQSYAKTALHKNVLQFARAVRLTGTPYLLGPGVPQERVTVLREAFRKVFTDPRLDKIWRTFVGAPATPILAEEQEATLKKIPRDRETIEIFKKLNGPDPLPAS